MPRVSWVHSFLANLKHKSGNSGVKRKKRDHSSGQIPRLPKGLSKRRIRVGMAGSLSSWFASSCVI